MATGLVWVGLDLGLQRTNICVIDNAGIPLHEVHCATSLDDLQTALAPFPAPGIGLMAVEAGSDMHIVRKLRTAGYPVGIFESRKASKFLALRRNKTDSSDARGLADLARLGRHTVSQVHLKSLECQELRSRLVMRHRLVRLRVAAEGAIRSRLALYGRPFKIPCSPTPVRGQVEALLEQLRLDEGVDLGGDLDAVLDVCESLRKYLKRLDAELEDWAKTHPIGKLLIEVPGVGPICAASFYSAVEDPMRFPQVSDVAAYLGLIPRRYQSGETSRTRGITKTGNKLTRSHLFTAATVLRSRAPDCALKDWVVSLTERIGSKRARVALARKLAIVLITMWKEGSHFEPYPERRAARVGN